MSEKTDSSCTGFRGQRPGIVAAIQFALFLGLCATVLVTLFYDTRLYYGIDVDGRPIYREVTRPELLRGIPVSADSATGIHAEGAEG